jgi:hypothetical protein
MTMEYKKSVMMEIRFREMGVLNVKKNEAGDSTDEEDVHQ